MKFFIRVCNAFIFLALLTSAFFVGAIYEQGHIPRRRPVDISYGIVLDPARRKMSNDWTDTVPQLERAYCAIRYDVIDLVDTARLQIPKQMREHSSDTIRAIPLKTRIVFLHDVMPALVLSASVREIRPFCGGAPIIHTHPPITCPDKKQMDKCYYGGVHAFDCQPSQVDVVNTITQPFGVVQCGKDQFVFYHETP